jgi:hypothetical protein
VDQITWSRPKVYKSGPDYLVAVSWAEGWGSCGVWADLVRWMTAGAAVGAACAACAAVGIGPIGIAHGSHRSDRHRSRACAGRNSAETVASVSKQLISWCARVDTYEHWRGGTGTVLCLVRKKKKILPG